MKHFYFPSKTVVTAAIVLISLLFFKNTFAQVNTGYFPVVNGTPNYGDSLYGFNEATFLSKASAKGLDAYETKMYMNQCRRIYVNRRYNLQTPTVNRDLASMRIGNSVAMLPCTNMDFEMANFTGWTGFIGDNTLSSSGPLQNIVNGFFSNGMDALVTDMNARHTIVSAVSGNDTYGGFPCVCPGGSYSCRLGNTYANYQGEAIEQTFTVGPGNTSFTYSYAAVLNDGGHSAGEQPYFRIEMFDQSGNLIPCAQYYVEAAGGNTPGFSPSAIDPLTYYKPWTTVNADLTAYMAQSVTIRFTAAGCIYAGHFGYAYVDASCLPYQIVANDSLCQGGSITLTAPVGAVAYLWSPGGQTTQSITVNTAGSYSVDMTSVTGCHTTLTINVAMYPTPIAAFTPNSSSCATNFTFTNNSSVSSGTLYYHWDFGDPAVTNDTSNVANPSYTYASSGTYTVTLTVTTANGCTATITQVVNPGNGGTAAFTNTTVCQGTATTFTDGSTGATAWDWNFGDPASGPLDSSLAQNPMHIFSAAGTYTVTLTAGTTPCTSTITHVVTVNPLPTALFTYSQICNSQTVNFTNTSSVTPPATITTSAWNFGDPASGGNNTSALANPSHTFTAAGTYTVTLTVNTSTGCPQTVTQVLNVGVPPVAAFSAPTVCVNNPTQFTNNSFAAGSFHWDFGDPALTNDTSNVANPAYTYTASGTYTVTLIANPGPCSDTTTVTITVAPTPTVAFVATSVCVGSATAFTDQSTIASGTITGWHWDFGDAALTNDTSNVQNPNYTYAATGTYTVTLTCISSNGCPATNTVSITVNALPTASFVYNQVCGGQSVNFTSTSTVSNPSTITSTNWDFGDPASGGNNLSTLLNPSHTFTATGTYTVTITVTTNNNCTQTITQIINVLPPPTSAFTATTVCTNSPMLFTNNSLNATSSHWDFGEAALSTDTSNLTNPSYTYTTAGTYTVTLISNPGPCADTATLSVTVAPGPQVQWVAPSVCLGSASSFTDQSSIASGNITNWFWNFGDPSTSADTTSTQNPTYTYTTAGTYTVTLTCTSNNGCTTTNTMTVTVNPLPVANFTSTVVCQGIPTAFTDLSVASSGNITSWTWDFGDGSGNSAIQNPNYTYGNDSTYNATLIVQNSNGCIDTVTVPVVVASTPNVIFTADTFAGCPQLCVNFSDLTTINSGTITGWSWDFGDGSPLSSQQNPSHCYSITGTYTVTMTATSSGGCVQTLVIPNMITVYPVPHASFSATPQHTTVLNTNISYTDLSTGNPVTWQWTFGDPTTTSDSSSLQNPTYQYTTEYGDTYPVNLVVTNQYGCVDDTTLEVIVDPEFTFYIPNAFTPNGDGVNDFFFGTGIGITSYQIWIFDRWGNLIFTTKDINEGWDGSVQGKGGDIAQIDVYVWKVALTDVFDKRHKYIGHVSLIK